MANSDVTTLINQIIAAAKPALQAGLMQVLPVLQAQTTDWLNGLAVLLTSDPDAAEERILAAMAETNFMADAKAAKDATDKMQQDNAAAAAQRAAWLKDALPVIQSIIGIIAGAAMMVL
jgi:hypothetical protein